MSACVHLVTFQVLIGNFDLIAVAASTTYLCVPWLRLLSIIIDDQVVIVMPIIYCVAHRCVKNMAEILLEWYKEHTIVHAVVKQLFPLTQGEILTEVRVWTIVVLSVPRISQY